MNQNAATKVLLRKQMRGRLQSQSALENLRASEKIAAHLQTIIENSPRRFQRAAVFLATPREPNLDAFARWLQARGVLALAPHSRENEKPFVEINADWSNISPNARGWREPEYSEAPQFSAHEVDVIFVPALAFDSTGARLGQGGGWYDRALENLPSRVLTVGVAFDFQIIQSVPRESHDQVVSTVVTEERIVEIKSDEPEA